MSGLITHEPSVQARTTHGRAPGLRARLAHDYAAARGRDPDYRQLDWLERVARWIGSLPEKERREVKRSVPQIVRALGLPYDGTVKGARNSYKRQLYSTFDALAEMGWIESRRPVLAASLEGEGILLRFPAGVAQSVRAAES